MDHKFTPPGQKAATSALAAAALNRGSGRNAIATFPLFSFSTLLLLKVEPPPLLRLLHMKGCGRGRRAEGDDTVFLSLSLFLHMEHLATWKEGWRVVWHRGLPPLPLLRRRLWYTCQIREEGTGDVAQLFLEPPSFPSSSSFPFASSLPLLRSRLFGPRFTHVFLDLILRWFSSPKGHHKRHLGAKVGEFNARCPKPPSFSPPFRIFFFRLHPNIASCRSLGRPVFSFANGRSVVETLVRLEREAPRPISHIKKRKNNRKEMKRRGFDTARSL